MYRELPVESLGHCQSVGFQSCRHHLLSLLWNFGFTRSPGHDCAEDLQVRLLPMRNRSFTLAYGVMLGMAGSVVAQDNKEQQPCARQELGRRSGNASITVKKTGGLLRPRQRRQSHLLRPLGISGSRPNRKAFSPGQSPTPVLVSRPESPGRYADVPSPIPVAYGPATTKTICLDRSCS